jgi:hypothetical protein
MNYTLSDDAIAAIAKLVQIAILTGTDVVDNLRTLKLTASSTSSLAPTEEFLSSFEEQINNMLNMQQEEFDGIEN